MIKFIFIKYGGNTGLQQVSR